MWIHSVMVKMRISICVLYRLRNVLAQLFSVICTQGYWARCRGEWCHALIDVMCLRRTCWGTLMALSLSHTHSRYLLFAVSFVQLSGGFQPILYLISDLLQYTVYASPLNCLMVKQLTCSEWREEADAGNALRISTLMIHESRDLITVRFAYKQI